MQKIRFFLFALAVVAGSILFGNPVFAGTNFQFSPSKITVKEGQTFTITAKVIPPGVKNYTVKMALEFPAEMVSVKSWSYADDWMPVRKSGYDVLSNDEGLLIRTAGYPEGFDSATSFGTITFLAKKSGVAVIKMNSGSFILDENSNNVATLPAPFSLNIEAPSVVPIPEVDEKTTPLQVPKQKVVPVVPIVPVPVPERAPVVPVTVPETDAVSPQNDIPVQEVIPVLTEPVKIEPVAPAVPSQKLQKAVSRVKNIHAPSLTFSDDSILLALVTALIFVLFALSRVVADMPNNKLRIHRP